MDLLLMREREQVQVGGEEGCTQGLFFVGGTERTMNQNGTDFLLGVFWIALSVCFSSTNSERKHGRHKLCAFAHSWVHNLFGMHPEETMARRRQEKRDIEEDTLGERGEREIRQEKTSVSELEGRHEKKVLDRAWMHDESHVPTLP